MSHIRKIIERSGLPSPENIVAGIIDRNIYGFYKDRLKHYGVELYEIGEALEKKRDALKKLLRENGLEDKIVIDKETVGFYIHVKPYSTPPIPIYACFILGREGIVQKIVNIIDIGRGSNVIIVKGCASIVPEGAHKAITLLRAGDHSRITNIMIHNWAPYITVSSKTYAYIGKGVEYNGYYVKVSPVKAIGLGSEYYVGENSRIEYHEATLAHRNTRVASNTRIVLRGRGSGGYITSRGVVNRGYMDVNPLIRAEAEDVKGHIECNGLILENGIYKTHPSLETTVENAYLTHEASIGKISGEQLFYLQTRGLDEEYAIRLIVLGFLTSAIKGLPDSMKKYMDNTMKYFIVKDRRFL